MSCILLTSPAAHASSFDQYGAPFRPISLPPTGPGSFGLAADCLPSGRMICVTGNQLFLESAPNSGVFSPVATFDPTQSSGSADPAFIRVSPDGAHIAVGLGTGKPVAIIPTTALGAPGSPTLLNTSSGTTYFNVPHTEAAWRNNSELALTAGVFNSPSRVTLLNTLSSPASPTNPTIITNIGGASAGIAFDSAGRLFTGNGFDLSSPAAGPSQTGWIKAFSPASWSTSTPADFESSGIFIADILSATSLLFDHDGSLIIGGGDFSASDTGYLGVLNHNSISSALLGGLINASDPAQLKRLAPTANPFEFYTSAYNPLTGELYAGVTGFSTNDPNTFYATIPSPVPAAALLALATLPARRRR